MGLGRQKNYNAMDDFKIWPARVFKCRWMAMDEIMLI